MLVVEFCVQFYWWMWCNSFILSEVFWC